MMLVREVLRIWSILLVVLLSHAISATPNPHRNDIKFEHITTNDGLSQNTIVCILQDSKGFMWFGTLDGVNKYDGYRFTSYKHDPSDSTSLSGSHVLTIYEDRTAMLWIGTQNGGLNRFNPETQTFTRYRHDPLNPNSLTSNNIHSIHEDSSGVFWIGAGGGLNKLVFDDESKSSPSFTHYVREPDNANSFGGSDAFSIYEDHKGMLWIGSRHWGLTAYDRKKEIFNHYRHDPDNPNSLSHNFASLIHGSDPGILWIGTFFGGLNKMVNSDGKAPTFIRYMHDPDNPNSLSHDRVYAIYEDRARKLWIGTQNGLNRFHPETETFDHFRHAPDYSGSLSNDVVYSVLEDRAGTLWVGTLSGLNKSAASANKFVQYTHDRNKKHTLSHNLINDIYEDKAGMIWVATEGGLNRFDPEAEKFTHYMHKSDNVNSLSDNTVHSVYEDRKEMLWIGTGNGLNRLDRYTETFTRYKNDPNDPNSISHNIVVSIHEDKAGTLWIGTLKGLNKFDRQTGMFSRYMYIPGDSNSLSYPSVVEILEDRSGILWLGTYGGGLNRFDPQAEKFRHYKHDPERPNSLSNNHISTIYEDDAGILWIGTEGGLNRLDRETQTIRHFTEKDGLPNRIIWAILPDDNGDLWLSTNIGLSRFNPQTETFRNYDIHDGLSGNEFNGSAAHKSISGEMYFGGYGLTRFHPDSVKDNPHIPAIVITDFQLFNESVPIGVNGNSPLQKHITATDEIVLSYKENVFSFEFAALDYSVPSKNQYAYMMEGFDSGWVYSGTRRMATYTTLPSGQYRFRAKGSNNDGIWNEDGTSIKITIVPPWWQTAWFKLLVAALLLSITIMSHKHRIRNLQARKQWLEALVSERTSDLRKRTSELQAQKELAERAEQTIAEQANRLLEMDRLKSQFFANISHEFRTPLTLILGPLEQMISTTRRAQRKTALEVMRRNARRLLRLVEQMLDLAKIETGKLRLELSSGDLIAFIKAINQSFAPWAECNHIAFTFESDIAQLIFSFDRDKLEKVIYNLLANAFKFTPQNGTICIAVTKPATEADPFIRITVSDTGVGIPPEKVPYIFDRFYQVDGFDSNHQGGTGIGLALTKELVELHGGDIHVKSEVGRGTEFTIMLPFKIEEDHNGDPLANEGRWDGRNLAAAVAGEPAAALPQAGEREMHHHDQVGGRDRNSDYSGKRLPIVLLVEDNHDVQNYINDNLAGNYRIVPAFDGAAGLKKAIDIIPDLIISDIMMPRMHGHELSRRLKNDERTSHIPIIMLTAKAAMESKLSGLATGADDYLVKPFDIRELKVRVKNLIQQRRKLREKFKREMIFKPSEIATSSPLDKAFLQKVHRIIEEKLPDRELRLETLSNEFHMSQSQLYRKTRALTGHSPIELIRLMRLNRAVELLNKRGGNITEIAFAVGFNNLSYFSKCFRKQFGIRPSEYKKDPAKELSLL